jgi:hypothetical protein
MGGAVNEKVDLAEVFRDAKLLADIRSHRRLRMQKNWRAWEILLPPTLLWPMVEEVSEGRMAQWSPTLDGVAVNVGEPGEVAIRFVLEGLVTSPVEKDCMAYADPRQLEPVEVRHGTAL